MGALDTLRSDLEGKAYELHRLADRTHGDEACRLRVAAAKVFEAVGLVREAARGVVEVPPCPSRDEWVTP